MFVYAGFEMSNENVNLELLYKLRGQFKRLDQLTWTIRDAQQRFPVGTPENELQLIRIYLSMLGEIEDIVGEIKEIKKNYDVKQF